jgi:hypothetical protein
VNQIRDISLFIECKSGRNVDESAAKQLRRYQDLTIEDLARQAAIPVVSRGTHKCDVVIACNEDSTERIAKGYREFSLEPKIIALGPRQLRLYQGQLSDEYLHTTLTAGVEIEKSLVPRWLIPILPDDPESEIAELVADAVIEAVVSQMLLRFDVERIASLAFKYNLWSYLGSNIKRNFRQHIRRILDNMARSEFQGVLQRVSDVGRNPAEWSVNRPIQHRNPQATTNYARNLLDRKLNFVNRLRIDEGRNIIGLPRELPNFEPEE